MFYWHPLHLITMADHRLRAERESVLVKDRHIVNQQLQSGSLLSKLARELIRLERKGHAGKAGRSTGTTIPAAPTQPPAQFSCPHVGVPQIQ